MTGLVAVFIIAVAFGLGRFLDAQFDAGGIFTVLLLVGSFPITLYAIVRVSLQMVQRTQASVDQLARRRQEAEQQEETSSAGENTQR